MRNCVTKSVRGRIVDMNEEAGNQNVNFKPHLSPGGIVQGRFDS